MKISENRKRGTWSYLSWCMEPCACDSNVLLLETVVFTFSFCSLLPWKEIYTFITISLSVMHVRYSELCIMCHVHAFHTASQIQYCADSVCV